MGAGRPIAGPRHGGGRERRARARGQSLVEFAICLPVILYLTSAIIDLARVNLMWNRALTALQYVEQLASEATSSWGYDGTSDSTGPMVEMACKALVDMKAPVGTAEECVTNQVVSFTDPVDDGYGGKMFTVKVEFTVTPLLPISFTGPDGTHYNLLGSYRVSRTRTVRWNKTTFRTDQSI
jgi:hypothetical protein